MSNDFIRTQNTVRIGTITLPSNEADSIATVQVKHNDFETHSDIGCIQQFGFVSAAPLHSAALTLALVGDNAAKLVVATHDPKTRYTGLQAGETAIHDAFQDSVVLTKDNKIEFRINGKRVAWLEADGLHVDGIIHATKDISTEQNVLATQNVLAGINIVANGSISALGISTAGAGGTITAAGDISTTGNLITQSDLHVAGEPSYKAHIHQAPNGPTSTPR